MRLLRVRHENRLQNTGVFARVKARALPLLLLTISLVNVSSAHADFDPMMSLDPRVDRFTRRIHARYGLLPDGAHRQPMGTAGFMSYLDSLSGLPLTPHERHTLEALRRRLSIDRGIYGFNNEDNDYGAIVNLDLTGEVRASAGDGDSRLGGRGVIGPRMRGYVGKVSFYSSLDVWTEYADTLFPSPDFQPYSGIPYELYGKRDERLGGSNFRSAEMPRGGIGFDAGRVGLLAAIDHLRIGPAVHYPLTLSGNAPPVTFARMVIDLTHVEYFHIAGVLRSQKDKPKYIYANGLRGGFFDRRLQWGISEVMIGGSTTNQQDDDPVNPTREELRGQEQGWEFAYLVPFVPMVFAERYTGEKTNAAIAFDVSLNWPRNFRFYAEMYLDDLLAPWEMLSDDWGNKWALTLGAQYFTSVGGRDVNAGIEWSRVEPWVYTHIYGGSHRYDHFDKSLGSPMGPNSMALTAHCDMSVTRKAAVGLKLTSEQNNASARGGNITDIFQPTDSEKKKFLGKGTIHHLRPGVYGRYDPFDLFWIDAAAEIDAARDKGRVHFQLDGGLRF